MHRFFVTAGAIVQDEVHFSAEISRQIARVLRLQPGKQVLVLDNTGNEFLVTLVLTDEKGCTGEIVARETCVSEPKTKLTMVLSLSQREKFEWMLQKCTEVGAARFLPVITSRSLVQSAADVQDKYPRWEKIIKEAAEQSGRGILPQLLTPLGFEAALSTTAQSHDLCLIPWEGEHKISLKNLQHAGIVSTVAVLIGPEGGFSGGEVELAKGNGFIPVSLGRRILRMETAAIVSAALVLHELDPG